MTTVSQCLGSQVNRIEPILVRLTCPACHKEHIDYGKFAIKPHRTHRCVSDENGIGCGSEWREPRKCIAVRSCEERNIIEFVKRVTADRSPAYDYWFLYIVNKLQCDIDIFCELLRLTEIKTLQRDDIAICYLLAYREVRSNLCNRDTKLRYYQAAENSCRLSALTSYWFGRQRFTTVFPGEIGIALDELASLLKLPVCATELYSMRELADEFTRLDRLRLSAYRS